MILAGAALSLSAFAANLESITESANKTQAEAREIAAMLKVKKPDFDAVKNRMATLESHSDELTKMIEEAEPTLGSQAEFAKVRELAKIVAVFVDNKKAMLESDDRAKNRELLRAKADGIAQRAELIRRAAQKLKS